MVGRRVLAPVMGVRALLPQPLTVDWPAPSSRGPGHGPLKAETRVRIPLGPPPKNSRISLACTAVALRSSYHRKPSENARIDQRSGNEMAIRLGGVDNGLATCNTVRGTLRPK